MLRAILLSRGVRLADMEPVEVTLAMLGLRHELLMHVTSTSILAGAITNGASAKSDIKKALESLYMSTAVEDMSDAKRSFDELNTRDWTITSGGIFGKHKRSD